VSRVATRIDTHFVFDSAFFDEVLAPGGGVNALSDLGFKLTYITSKASGNKKRQNKISPRSFQRILDNHPVREEALRIFLNRVEAVPQFEAEQNEVVRTIKYAIFFTIFANTGPNRSLIFTSSERRPAYTSSPHLHGISSVAVESGTVATATIDRWFRQCRQESGSSCD
jgi:hypothetical protein